MKTFERAWILLMAAAFLPGCEAEPSAPSGAETQFSRGVGQQALAVSGSGVAFATTAIVHSQAPTGAGMIERSTSIIQLTGDLDGYILFQPISVFDFQNGTLVNTGTQLFSGTILGSAPVILRDHTFRFDVDLATGATIGEVRLSRSNDAPHKGGWFECSLVIVGTGATPAGDPTSDYSGECIRRGNLGGSA